MFLLVWAADIFVSPREFWMAVEDLRRVEVNDLDVKGWNRVPFAQQNTYRCVQDIFERAVHQGNCIAPFFLQWMQENGKLIDENGKVDPSRYDCTLVPTHKPLGPLYKKYFKFYLRLCREVQNPFVIVHMIEDLSNALNKQKQRIKKKKAILNIVGESFLILEIHLLSF